MPRLKAIRQVFVDAGFVNAGQEFSASDREAKELVRKGIAELVPAEVPDAVKRIIDKLHVVPENKAIQPEENKAEKAEPKTVTQKPSAAQGKRPARKRR